MLTALAVSWFLSSRIARQAEHLSTGATRIAAGDNRVRAPAAVADDELADLTLAFNDMARALETTETTRRQLLADLAHELRTPLATLEGYLEALEDGVVDAGSRTWTTMREATERMDRLVDDICLVSKAEEHRLEVDLEPDVEVTELVDAAVTAARPAYAERGIALTMDIR